MTKMGGYRGISGVRHDGHRDHAHADAVAATGPRQHRPLCPATKRHASTTVSPRGRVGRGQGPRPAPTIYRNIKDHRIAWVQAGCRADGVPG
jgi:hypothetical protein